MESAIIIGIVFLVFIGFVWGKAAQDNRYKAAYEQQEKSLHREMAAKEKALEDKIATKESSLVTYSEERAAEFARLVGQARELDAALKTGMLEGRKWLASAFAEFIDTRDLEVESWLAEKPHPALSAAQQVARIREKHREVVRRLKFAEMQIASYEEYFPFLVEYRDAILDESVDLRSNASEALDEADPALSRGYLTTDEYASLSSAEKFQLALDRYWSRKKGPWEIGRVYERYLGYLYEHDGWRVQYHGILKGLEDFGRDLICTKGDSVHIVQCKCWSQSKQIHEKHVFQLHGTTVLFKLQLLGLSGNTTEAPTLFDKGPFQVVQPVFATTTLLSRDASLVAKHLGVHVRHEELRRYPIVKCNINPKTQERIYHLPFDQQYDKIVIGNLPGECYADTVAEAEAAGFRRAFQWQGTKGIGDK